MHSDLNRFLQGEHSEGRLDSEGTFTVSLDRALEKVARYSLERPGAWILKIVQAAVGLGATRLNGRVLRGWVNLEIRFEREGPSWRLVRDAIAQPELETDSPLNDLSVGLWSLAQGAGRRFQLEATAAGPGGLAEYPSLGWSGSELVVNNKGPVDSPCREFRITINRPSTGMLSRVARVFGGGSYFLDELNELHRLAYLQPIDGSIEGISGHHFLRAQTGVKGVARGLGILSYPNPFGWGWCSSEELPELGIHPRWAEFANHIKNGGQFERGQKWLALDLWGDRPGAIWALSFDFGTGGLLRASERSEIRWLRHGVIVDQTPLPSSSKELTLGVVLHLSAAGLPTDLGGMRLQLGDAFSKRYGAGLRALRRNLKPEQVRGKIFNWGLPHQIVEACLNQVQRLRQALENVDGPSA